MSRVNKTIIAVIVLSIVVVIVILWFVRFAKQHEFTVIKFACSKGDVFLSTYDMDAPASQLYKCSSVYYLAYFTQSPVDGRYDLMVDAWTSNDSLSLVVSDVSIMFSDGVVYSLENRKIEVNTHWFDKESMLYVWQGVLIPELDGDYLYEEIQRHGYFSVNMSIGCSDKSKSFMYEFDSAEKKTYMAPFH